MANRACLAAGCDCETFIPPKNGKLCADSECQHPLGTHCSPVPVQDNTHSLAITSSSALHSKVGTAVKGKEIISIDDEEDDFRLVESRGRGGKREFVQPFLSTRHSMILGQPPHFASTTPVNSNSTIQSSMNFRFSDEVNRARKKAATRMNDGEQLSTSSRTSHTIYGFGKSARLGVPHRISPPKPLQIRITIWTKIEGQNMFKENGTQWWSFGLSEFCENYENWLVKQAVGHIGWVDRKGKDIVILDVGILRPILIGEMESRGDPTTITVPQTGGTWQELLAELPGFLDDLPATDTSRNIKRPKPSVSARARCLAIVLPTTMQIQDLGSDTSRAPGWTPAKEGRLQTRRLLRAFDSSMSGASVLPNVLKAPTSTTELNQKVKLEFHGSAEPLIKLEKKKKLISSRASRAVKIEEPIIVSVFPISIE